MKIFTVLVLAFAVLAMVPSSTVAQSMAPPTVTVTSTAITSTADIATNYQDGSVVDSVGTLAGIESTTRSSTGVSLTSTFSGVFSIDGKTFALPPKKLKVRGSLRFYRAVLVCGDVTYRVSLMLNHPQSPIFLGVTREDVGDSSNVGVGHGNSGP